MAYTARAVGVAAAGLLAFGLSASPAFAEEEEQLVDPVEETQEAVEDIVGEIVVPEAPGLESAPAQPQSSDWDSAITLELSANVGDIGGGDEDPGGGTPPPEDPEPTPPPVDPTPTPPPEEPVDPSPSPEPPDPSPSPEDPAPGPDPDDDADADEDPGVTVVVEEASSGSGTGGGEELPVTGGALENLVLGGVLATGIGAMTLLGARRRTPLAE